MKINDTIKIISEKLKDVNYAFIGSGNLYIQGMQVEPRDIDVLTTPEDIKIIDGIFEEYRTKEIYFDESEGRNSYRSFYKINDIEIEVLGNVNNVFRDKELFNHRIAVEFQGVKVYCMPLKDEVGVYKKMGRSKKAELIEKFLIKTIENEK